MTARRDPRPVLAREDGGIDLPSTMVSILVVAVFLAAAALAVFVVIPWAQDNAAKHKAADVVSAQSAYYATTADDGDPRYGKLPHLQSAGLIGEQVTVQHVLISTGHVNAASPVVDRDHSGNVRQWLKELVPTTPGQDSFVVVVKSETGRQFMATNENPQPVQRTVLDGEQ